MGSKVDEQGFGVGLVTVAVLCGTVPHVRAGPIVFVNDYPGFLSAAGDVRTIDFETLPDGSPSTAGTQITPEFNYTDQGVTFTGHASTPYFYGNPIGGLSLRVDSYPLLPRDWFIADFVLPAKAVGVFFPGDTTLSVFDAMGGVIVSASFGGSGSGLFLGIITDEPFVRVNIDRGGTGQIIESFHFTPIPEPATMILLALGGIALLVRSLPRLLR